MDRIHALGARDGRAGPLRQLQRHHRQSGAQRILPRRPSPLARMMTADRPVGPQIEATPAQAPGAIVLHGRFGRVEELDRARHGAALWDAVRRHDEVWTYMAYGPFADQGTFLAWLDQRVRLADPFSYAIVDASDRALGIATLMEIRPAMRVIEVGHIV